MLIYFATIKTDKLHNQQNSVYLSIIRSVVCVIALFSVSVASLQAEKGVIPLNPLAKITKTQQCAFIAWNEDLGEEMLTLSSEISASLPTEVLEFVPFPTMPVVKPMDRSLFQKLERLVKKSDSGNGNAYSGKAMPSALQFYPQVSVEGVTIEQFLGSGVLFKWLQDYFNGRGFYSPEIKEGMKKILYTYTKERFSWFVFNRLEVDQKVRSSEPMMYHFKTPSLYYPLRVHRPEGGSTFILIFIMAPHSFNEFSGFPVEKIDVIRQYVPVPASQLRSISRELYDFFGGRNDIVLHVWAIKERCYDLHDDLFALGYATSNIENVDDIEPAPAKPPRDAVSSEKGAE